jgi:hypothetical protein
MSTIPGYRARRTELRRQQPFNAYDRMRQNGTHKSIGQCKTERLAVKNARRVNRGLFPKATYAEI